VLQQCRRHIHLCGILLAVGTHMPILICIACMVAATVSTPQTLISTHVLVHQEAGTYDAGISTSTTSATSYCRDTHSVLLVLLVHDVLVVCIIPQELCIAQSILAPEVAESISYRHSLSSNSHMYPCRWHRGTIAIGILYYSY